MKPVLDAFWRALLDCFRPKIIGLTLLPLGIMLVLGMLLSYFYWGMAVEAVANWLNSSTGWALIGALLEQAGLDRADVVAFVAPLLVFLLASPLLAIVSLLIIGIFMNPFMVSQVKARRFPHLMALGKDSLLHGIWWSLLSTLIALAALLISMPLWLILPLAFVIPPLIWGWLACRMFSFDALIKHASPDERSLLMQQHRWPLLIMGIVCGYLGAAPSLIWASGVVFAFAFPLLIPLGIWIYTWVFAFSALWFVHYCLQALYDFRLANGYDLEVLDALDPSSVERDRANSVPSSPVLLSDARGNDDTAEPEAEKKPN